MPTDMKRIYVVERMPISDNPADKDLWLSVGTYDQPADAGKHAADLKPTVGVLNRGVRVRQFWVESTTPEQHPLQARATTPVDVPLVELQCIDHPDVRVSVYDQTTAGPRPKCKYCQKQLVRPEFAEALDLGLADGDLMDLTGGKP